MKSMKDFFGSLFGKSQKPQLDDKLAREEQRNEPQRKIAEIYDKGDVIGGRYEVHGILGKGGYGLVFLVYNRDTGEVVALKTFRDELLADAAARQAFKKEALLWVKLDTHPFILAARWVEEISGRLFVAMDYIAPDDKGCVNLDDHLTRSGGPLDTDRALKWAIQFCMGMEHASAHGIKCHRDIKPANILITQDGTLKITDFGLAAAAEVVWRGTGGRGGSLVAGDGEAGFGFSLLQAEGKIRCGTPGYMPPEIYRYEAADLRSDIYSFGLVLWQMATGSRVPPFVVPYRGDLEGYLREIYEQQMTGRVPRVDGFLGPVIERCLRQKPAERYGSFDELREALEPILERRTGKGLEVPEVGDKTVAFWNNKGVSLHSLGMYQDAIASFERALELDPGCATAWTNKGSALVVLGRHQEAIACFDKALVIDAHHVGAWIDKGTVLFCAGRCTEAIACYDKALTIEPENNDAWNGQGGTLAALLRHDEAIVCYDRALATNPRNVKSWTNKARSLNDLGRSTEAIVCYDKALEIDPMFSTCWNDKGAALHGLGQYQEAIICFDKALVINHGFAEAWFNKAISQESLGQNAAAADSWRNYLEVAMTNPRQSRFLKAVEDRLGELENVTIKSKVRGIFSKNETVHRPERPNGIDFFSADTWLKEGVDLYNRCRYEEALARFDRVLVIDPKSVNGCLNKGNALGELGRHEEAIVCYEKVLEIKPDCAEAWFNKGVPLEALGRSAEAIACFDRVIALNAQLVGAWLRRAGIHLKLGNKLAAISDYRKALEIGRKNPAEHPWIYLIERHVRSLEHP